MSIEFDDKGKYFTDIISKTPVFAVIQTTTHRIEGIIHIRADERVKNELDRTDPFLAVTNARIFAADGSVLFATEFVTVARSQIVWVIPNEKNAQAGEK